MPIDYRRLVDGMSNVVAIADEGEAALVAIDKLLAAAADATGAVGATFTEYGDAGGRVVAAKGVLAWALGQPIAAEFVTPDQIAHAWAGRVDTLPVQVAEPLLSRGVVAMVAQPVRGVDRVLGAVHLYFGELDEEAWSRTAPALRLVGACASRVLAHSGEVSPPRPAVEEDDRNLFLAVAGHELRTPVTVIKGYASLLSDRWDALAEQDRRAAALVLTQRANDLAQLVDRLLGSTAGDSSGWLVRTVPFDPLDALLHAAAEMPAELRRAMRMQLPNRLPPASGDPDILGSVVTELVINAVRATPTGVGPAPASVDILAGADTATVFIQVCDRGVGIDPAHAERAFERFWRDRRATEGRGGVGLGLYLVRRLVERQNGWVSLRPRDGGGTIAEVRLGRADGPPPPVLDRSGPTASPREA
jgi:two-component system, OmpR family, phosphate regulon sensor histidine kinase PhoR